jgi:hypothetical protein
VGKFAYLTLAVRCVNVWCGQLRAARRLNCCADQEHQDGWHRNSLPKLYSQLGLEVAVSASPLVGRGNIRDRGSRLWRASFELRRLSIAVKIAVTTSLGVQVVNLDPRSTSAYCPAVSREHGASVPRVVGRQAFPRRPGCPSQSDEPTIGSAHDRY